MTRFRLFASVAVVALLAGCGFHLRNAIDLPPDLGPVKVTSTAQYSPLVTSLEQGLKSSGAVLVEGDAKGKTARLQILSERWGNLPIAIDQYGRSQEYSMRYATVFVFRHADGTDLVPQQVVELSRDYVSSPIDVTGTTTEREVIAEELRREMAASILRRIDGVLRTSGQ